MKHSKLVKKLKHHGHDPALFIQLSRNNQKRILKTIVRKPNHPKLESKNGKLYGPNINHPYLGPAYKQQWVKNEE